MINSLFQWPASVAWLCLLYQQHKLSSVNNLRNSYLIIYCDLFITLLVLYCLPWLLGDRAGVKPSAVRVTGFCFPVHPSLPDNPHGPDPRPHRRVPRCAPGAEGRWRGRRWRQAEVAARPQLCAQPRQPAQL